MFLVSENDSLELVQKVLVRVPCRKGLIISQYRVMFTSRSRHISVKKGDIAAHILAIEFRDMGENSVDIGIGELCTQTL